MIRVDYFPCDQPIRAALLQIHIAHIFRPFRPRHTVTAAHKGVSVAREW
jgi:hypothetical protein